MRAADRLALRLLALRLLAPCAPARPRQRGSQSVEWVGLTFVVMTVMAAAYREAGPMGGAVGHAIVDHLTQALQPAR